MVLMNMGESKYLHFSKVYLGCTLSQLNHMVSKERWNRGRGLKLLQKAIPSLPICMKEHFWHHTMGNIWQWQLSQWISKQGLSQSLHLFFSKQLWLLLLKLQGLKVGKIFNLHSGKNTNMWVATLSLVITWKPLQIQQWHLAYTLN